MFYDDYVYCLLLLFGQNEFPYDPFLYLEICYLCTLLSITVCITNLLLTKQSIYFYYADNISYVLMDSQQLISDQLRQAAKDEESLEMIKRTPVWSISQHNKLLNGNR